MRRYPFDEAAGSLCVVEHAACERQQRLGVRLPPTDVVQAQARARDRVRIAKLFGHRYRLESRRLGLFVRQSAVGGTDGGMAGSDREQPAAFDAVRIVEPLERGSGSMHPDRYRATTIGPVARSITAAAKRSGSCHRVRELGGRNCFRADRRATHPPMPTNLRGALGRRTPGAGSLGRRARRAPAGNTRWLPPTQSAPIVAWHLR